MRTIIAGSRRVKDFAVLEAAVAKSGFTITEVVSGTASGVDKLGEVWAEMRGVPVKQFPAKWDDLTAPGAVVVTKGSHTYNARAGGQRNQAMAEYAEALIAIWDGKSRGTSDMISRARRRRLTIFVETVTLPPPAPQKAKGGKLDTDSTN